MATVRSRSQKPRREHAETSERRRAILAAALECFSNNGYDRTTMSDVRELAGASTGSIYHHFESKEHLARALFLEGTRDTQEAGLRALLRHRSTEQGIRALVAAYLDWVEAHPDWARFLLSTRHAGFMEAGEEELSAMNRETNEAARVWIQKRVENGELPRIDPSLLRALIFGPPRHFARRYLDAATTVSMSQAKQILGTSIWQGIVALCSGNSGR